MKSKNSPSLRTALWLAALAAAVPACGCVPGRTRQRPPAAHPAVSAWDCEGGVTLGTRYHEDGVWLRAPGVARLLPCAVSASGARHADAATGFWSKDGTARYTHGGRTPACEANRRRAWFEGARLRGAVYRGTGNEPGWAAEIGPERIHLETDSGARRMAFPAGEPEVSGTGRATEWHSRSGADAVVVRVVHEPCRDGMSGDPLPSRVTVELDGTVLRGCGRALDQGGAP